MSRANDHIVIRKIKRRLRAVEAVVGEDPDTDAVRTRMVKDEYGWTRVAANGRRISTSGEGYGSKGYAIRMASDLNPGLPLVDEQGHPLT